MKKLILILAFLVLGLPAPLVSAAPSNRVQTWDLSGPYVINFDCLNGCAAVPHFITISDNNLLDGAFSGNGYYQPNPSYTWDVSGNLDGDNLTMHIDYTGQEAAYYADLVGTVGTNGVLSGTAVDASLQQLNWQTSSGAASRTAFKNHGQFVKTQDTKNLAAQSSIGKPQK